VRPDSLGLRDAVQRARHQLGDTHVLDDDIVTAAEESAEAAEETDLVVDDRANVDPSEHAHLSRLELASTLNGRDLFWSFAVPAGVTALAALILVQFWAAIWVYGLILAASLVAGSAWYVGAHYWRRRRAKSVRSTRQQASYDDIAVLVKKADTDDVTCYYGWVGGTVCTPTTMSFASRGRSRRWRTPILKASPFRRRSSKVRAQPPAVPPESGGYEEAVEKAEIRDRLIQEVAESPSNRLPKNRLADRVIRRDKDRIGGVGYDPRLVAEAYDAVVPYALVEDTSTWRRPPRGRSPCRSSDSGPSTSRPRRSRRTRSSRRCTSPTTRRTSACRRSTCTPRGVAVRLSDGNPRTAVFHTHTDERQQRFRTETHDPSSASSVQPEDSISVGEAIDKQISDSLIERVEQDNRSIEAVVRSLIAEAEDALAGNSPYDAEAVLETIHYFLIHDDRIDDLLAPTTTRSTPQRRFGSRTTETAERQVRLHPRVKSLRRRYRSQRRSDTSTRTRIRHGTSPSGWRNSTFRVCPLLSRETPNPSDENESGKRRDVR